jgi:tetratricopeptide (TPR) repeat protein
MKTSEKVRRRSSQRGPASLTRQATLPLLTRTLKGFVILGVVVAVGFVVFHFFWQGGSSDAQPPSTLSAGTRSANTAAVRQVMGNNDEFTRQVNRGNQLLAEGKPAEAVDVLSAAMRQNPNNEDVHYDLGLALARQGKVDEAIQQYNEALRIFPSYVEAHNNLGNLLMRAGRTEEGIQHFETALKIMPDYASAHNNLGTAFQKQGRLDEALQHFQKAAKLNPDYWEAHFNVGLASLQLGQTNEARGELETVRRLRPDFEPAQLALEALNRQKTGAPAATVNQNP